MSSKFTSRQKLDELWRRGIIAPLLLHSSQLDVYNQYHENSEQLFVMNISRRFGKSFLLIVIAIETALRKPNADIKIVTMSQKATRKIIEPLVREVLETCPKALRPKFTSADGIWRFPNGSTIHACGTEQQQIDNLRGQACDLALVDEAGFVESLEYAIESVIKPQFLGRPGARLVMASTPPISPDHPFITHYLNEAIQTGAYAHRTIYDNPRLTERDIEDAKKAAGGEGTTAFKREYLAQLVTERESAMFPEATADVLDEMIADIEPPSHFIPCVAIDLGYNDFTGVVFGYYHFPLAKIVVQDELLLNRMNSAQLIEAITTKEKALWGNRKPTRIVDASGLLVADLNEVHRFACRPAEKADFPGNVNRLRMDIQARNLILSTKCPRLMAQLQFATWDKTRRSFSRSRSNTGHSDLAAAMIYFARHVDRHTNPVPPGYGYDHFTTFGVPTRRATDLSERMRGMFSRLYKAPTK